jgi:hypothetical protein
MISNRIGKIFATSLFLFVFSSLEAQENQNLQWLQYYLKTKPDHDIRLNFDGGYRWKSAFSEPSQYIIRGEIGREVKTGMIVSLGMAHLGFYDDRLIYRHEYRPHIQITKKNVKPRVNLSHRIRIEYRYYREYATSDRSEIELSSRWRPRYRFQFNFPLIRNNDHWKLSIGDELLLHIGKSVGGFAFNQNRILVGPIYQVNNKMNFTFLFHWRQTGLGDRTYRNDYIYWLGLVHSI